jgi:hypothetical protein
MLAMPRRKVSLFMIWDERGLIPKSGQRACCGPEPRASLQGQAFFENCD